jgi:cytochrome c oxidase subunit 3
VLTEPAANAPIEVAPTLARHRATTALLGMVVFMASWAMLFAGLFFAYGVVRARALAWPPADLPNLPLALPALGTLLLALSSAALARAGKRARAGQSGVAGAIAGAGLLGLGFLTVQTVVWTALWRAGLRPESGPYGSTFYGLTVFHALHVVVGLLALAALALRPRAAGGPGLRLWTLYWHMVGVIWALMYGLVYCL